MYRFVCHSCKEREYFGDLGNAQTAFNEHAQEQHEVVIRRLRPRLREYIAELNDGEIPDVPLEHGTESEDAESADG